MPEASGDAAGAGVVGRVRAASRLRDERLRLAAVIVGGGIVAIMLYILLFRFVDDGLNGAFVNWFFSTFVYQWEVDYQTNTTYNLVFNATGAKEFFLKLGLVFVMVLVVVSAAAAHLYARRRRRETLEEAAELLAFFMKHDAEASEVFPAGFDALALQASQIKGTMAAHEQALREEAARKNDLITYLAHDLKTPLTSVIGYLSLIDEVPDMPAEQRCRYVGITLEKAVRLERLINEFFDITRYNLQHIELELEPVNVSFLLVQLTDEFYPLLAAHGNTCVLTVAGVVVGEGVEPPEITLMADPGRLARVFNNVLKNAVAYSSEGTPIEVEASVVEGRLQKTDADDARDSRDADAAQASSGRTLEVAITDTGATIPPHKLETIFDKFFRLDETRSTATGGAGLGLAIAREIVELHGGTITATSEAGRTTFIIRLPMD